MSRGAAQEVDDSNITQVSWSGLDFRKVWQVFPKAERMGSLDAAFKEGTIVFAFKDAFGNNAYAFVDNRGCMMSHGSHSLAVATVESLKAAGAAIR
jgi:hypothetical protein